MRTLELELFKHCKEGENGDRANSGILLWVRENGDRANSGILLRVRDSGDRANSGILLRERENGDRANSGTVYVLLRLRDSQGYFKSAIACGVMPSHCSGFPTLSAQVPG